MTPLVMPVLLFSIFYTTNVLINLSFINIFAPFLRRCDGVCRQVVCSFVRPWVSVCQNFDLEKEGQVKE